MDEFGQEIARRAQAASEAYQRRRRRPQQRRENARAVLSEVRRRFVCAALAADGRLKVHYLDSSREDRAVGYALSWSECRPHRDLCVRLDEVREELQWELASTDLRLSQRGSARTREFAPELLLDRLIYALLDQETWQRSILPKIPLDNAGAFVEDRAIDGSTGIVSAEVAAAVDQTR